MGKGSPEGRAAPDDLAGRFDGNIALLIKLIDDQVGSLLDALGKAQDMLDSTYIIFTSDHGEMLGDHGLFQKQLPYEPSMHIPLIMSGPGIKRRPGFRRAGRVCLISTQLSARWQM